MKDRGLHIAIRRLRSLILAAVYILFSIGILKATHFCMGRKAYETFFTTEAKTCGCSALMEETNDCCDDEHGLLKIDNEQKTISIFALNVPEWMVLEKLYSRQLLTSAEPTHTAFESYDPVPPDQPLFKMHCSFVFYDDDLIA